MFQWLRDTAEKKIIESHLSEMMPWMQQLNSLSDEDVGTIYLTALGSRNIFLNTMGVDLFHPEQAVEKNKALAVVLRSEIRDAQKSSLYASANGFKVWLFTVRSVTHNELRPVGLAIWRQLTRGIPHVYAISERIYKQSGIEIDLTDCGKVPVGFEPTAQ